MASDLATLKTQFKNEVTLDDNSVQRIERAFDGASDEQKKQLLSLLIDGARYQKFYNKAWFGALVAFVVMLVVLLVVIYRKK